MNYRKIKKFFNNIKIYISNKINNLIKIIWQNYKIKFKRKQKNSINYKKIFICYKNKLI